MITTDLLCWFWLTSPLIFVCFAIFDLVMVIGFEKFFVGILPMSGMNVAPSSLACVSDRQLGHLQVETFQNTVLGVAKCIRKSLWLPVLRTGFFPFLFPFAPALPCPISLSGARGRGMIQFWFEVGVPVYVERFCSPALTGPWPSCPSCSP